MRPRRSTPLLVILLAAVVVGAAAQQQALPAALVALADTERAFARRATTIGWKQAFLEYFADDAVGFDGDRTVSARDQLRQLPDPPQGVQLLWEPRYGDVAASGELGWLTGPSTSINPARNNGAPRYGNYASVWKKQADGTFKVLLDVGTNLPNLPAFAPGLTRAPAANRYRGEDSVASATRALRDADSGLNEAAQLSQAQAYAGILADGARLHRNDTMPLTGEPAILAWLADQPRWTAGATRQAESARSRELGYTYGTYVAPPGKGFYTRVWVRERDGRWKVVLDVLQPQ